MDDYKFLQTELSYLKDLFGKLNKGKSDLNHMLSVQKHTKDKTGLGYNKQATFSKKTKFVSSKGVNPNKVSQKRNIVYSKKNAKTCHYCMKRGHTSYKYHVRRFDVPRGKYM